MASFPKRKKNRLECYDYSQDGAYFITICTEDKQCILSRIIPSQKEYESPTVQLTEAGRLIEREIGRLNETYTSLSVDNYVIMPNHLHLLIMLESPDLKETNRVQLKRAINQFKGSVSKKIGRSIWQKGYHDHIVRDDRDYERRWLYIEDNPRRWDEDPERSKE